MDKSKPLSASPSFDRGPFYPPRPNGIPLLMPARAFVPEDPSASLIREGEHFADDSGEMIHVSGRVLDQAGRGLASIEIEIWNLGPDQLYVVEPRAKRSGVRFKGFGRQRTGNDGAYRFTTLRPRGYKRLFGMIRRIAHVHFLVRLPDRGEFTTEMWFADQAGWDILARQVKDEAVRARVFVAPALGADGVPEFTFDIVIPDDFGRRAES